MYICSVGFSAFKQDCNQDSTSKNCNQQIIKKVIRELMRQEIIVAYVFLAGLQ